jgi:hypothetical protein
LINAVGPEDPLVYDSEIEIDGMFANISVQKENSI